MLTPVGVLLTLYPCVFVTYEHILISPRIARLTSIHIVSIPFMTSRNPAIIVNLSISHIYPTGGNARPICSIAGYHISIHIIPFLLLLLVSQCCYLATSTSHCNRGTI